MKNNGLVTAKSYPFMMNRQACKARGERYGKFAVPLRIVFGHRMLLQAMLAMGPIAARIHLTNEFKNYKGGKKIHLIKSKICLRNKKKWTEIGE